MNPVVSVVMSVFNGEDSLRDTIESILRQTLTDFEFIIINDGSTDQTADILTEYSSSDNRIRVITTQNNGLTSALIRGCKEATSPIIARQDVGDCALPDRLKKQLDLLNSDHSIVAVGCGAFLVGPEGEDLGSRSRILLPEEVTAQLQKFGIGLCHPLSTFRKDIYDQIGGYRVQFRYAQDTDLWYRFSEAGLLAEHPECLSIIRVDLTGVSGQNKDRQVLLAQLAKQCFEARKNNESETQYLQQAEKISQQKLQSNGSRHGNHDLARPAYFIGSLLLSRRDPACRKYFIRAMRLPPLFAQALIKYCASFFVCKRSCSFE